MKKIILETLVLAAFAAGQAQAAPAALDNASITATYNGTAGVLGLDHGFADEAGSNTSKLDATGSGVEFITGDALFAFDFSSSGQLAIYNNSPADPTATYKLTFDFGGTLSAPITSFTLVDGSGLVAGTPGLSVVGANSIALDLSGLTWNTDYTPITAQIGTTAVSPVPEPDSIALMLAGLGGVAFCARRRKAGQQHRA